jgi:3-hydroxybutyryl-CoA dehydrogenase
VPPHVAVVGAGPMGAGLVRLFAAAGYAVRVLDERSGAAEAAARAAEGAQASGSLAELVADADLCVEAIVEELAPKQALFAELARVAAPTCVLATNTSALSVDAIAEAVAPDVRPRVLGTHFFNPPDVVPAVEVVRGHATDEWALELALRLVRGAGKRAAVVRDSPGFVANRIQHAMVIEAWRCYEEGIATPAAIDMIVRSSFGFRLLAYGPFQLGDLNGLDVYRSVMRLLEAAYGERFAPPPALLALVEEGAYGTKSGRGVYEYGPGEVERLVRQRDDLLRQLAEFQARENHDA